jgi:predicted TIM-barrel fold metal-dependent hydrolase
MNHQQSSVFEPTRRMVLGLAAGTGLATVTACAHHTAERCDAAEEENAKQPAIDTHIHVVSPALPGLKPKPKDVEDLYKGPPEGMVKRLETEMAQAKIKIAFGMGSPDGAGKDPLGIAGTVKLSQFIPGLKAIGVADPRRIEPEHLKAVEAEIEQHRDNMVAFKAYLGYLHYGPEDSRYFPYYKLAAKYRLPVVLHTGDNWSTKAKVKFAHPLRLDEVAVDFPDVRFVMAHFGNPWLIDAAEVIFKNRNVWADLSGLFVGTDKQIGELLCSATARDAAAGLVFADLRKALEYVDDYSRFIYGSDWPLAPMKSYRLLIEAIIPKEHHEKVLRTNAEYVFGLAR